MVLRRLAEPRKGEQSCLACGLLDPTVVMSPVYSFSTVLNVWAQVAYPLCLGCWHKSPTDARLEHYRAMWLETNPGPQDMAEWFAIEAAVLDGKYVGVPVDRGPMVVEF